MWGVGGLHWGGRLMSGLRADGRLARCLAHVRPAHSTVRPAPAAGQEVEHRLELRAGKVTALLVDNHYGLAGVDQTARRAAIPEAADGQGALYCEVPFADRNNGYSGLSRLAHADADSPSPFSPSSAGHNCEFFFNASGGATLPVADPVLATG